MIIEDVADIFTAMGRRIDMVATGPMPGRTPINVPTNTPIKQANKLGGSKLIEKPYKML